MIYSNYGILLIFQCTHGSSTIATWHTLHRPIKISETGADLCLQTEDHSFATKRNMGRYHAPASYKVHYSCCRTLTYPGRPEPIIEYKLVSQLHHMPLDSSRKLTQCTLNVLAGRQICTYLLICPLVLYRFPIKKQ